MTNSFARGLKRLFGKKTSVCKDASCKECKVAEPKVTLNVKAKAVAKKTTKKVAKKTVKKTVAKKAPAKKVAKKVAKKKTVAKKA